MPYLEVIGVIWYSNSQEKILMDFLLFSQAFKDYHFAQLIGQLFAIHKEKSI